jgi:mRNA-degrading endonuclease RelE of RelBE toxin-antitoxin system
LSGLLELRQNPKKGKELAGRYRGLYLFLFGGLKMIYDFNSGQNIIFIVDIGKNLKIC